MAHMRKIIAIGGGIIVVIIALLTSKSLRDFTISSESKINKAVPISEKLRITKTATFEASTGAQWKEIEEELEARLKIRALRCAGGYSPAFYVKTETAKKYLTDLNCFGQADNEIADWLGLRRVGVLLSKTALKPIPKTSPSYIVVDAAVQSLVFAGNAGVAMLETTQELQIIDIESQKPILREPKGSTLIGPMTANGRLFITGDTDRLKIRETESGTVIAELNGIRPQDFHWLDEITALYNKVGSEKTFLIDFATGKEVPIQAINKQVTQVVHMPQTTNQFAAFSSKGITKFEIIRAPTGVEGKLLDEKHDAIFSSSPLASGITADGLHYFHAGRQITIVSMSTLSIQTTPLDAFHARFAAATADPDRILLVSAPLHSGEGGRSMLYSISKRSMTPLDRTQLSAQRYQYANILKRQAAIIDNKIALLEVLPDQKTEPSPNAASAPRVASAPAAAPVAASVTSSAPKTDASPKADMKDIRNEITTPKQAPASSSLPPPASPAQASTPPSTPAQSPTKTAKPSQASQKGEASKAQ